MAKKPTPVTPAAAPNPWAKPGEGEQGNGGGAPASAASESPEQSPVPAEEAVEQATETAPAGETPSEVSDQVTPTGDNPSEVVKDEVAAVVDGKAHTPAEVKQALADAPEGETPAEAVDQVTPIGTDLALAKFLGAKGSGDPEDAKRAARDLMATLSEGDQNTIEQHISAEAMKIIEKVAKGRKAEAEAANMVDGTQLYGNRARARAKSE